MNGPDEAPPAGDDGHASPGRSGRGPKAAVARRAGRFVEATMAPAVDEAHARLAEVSHRAEVLREEHEVLADELRSLRGWIDSFIAELDPVGGSHPLSESQRQLRADLRAVERSLREVTRHTARPPAPATGDEVSSAAPPHRSGALEELVGYESFERRFRGDPAAIEVEQAARYADLLAPMSPVVDIGCGRGELLLALKARGADVVGVEPSASMAALARDKGLEVHEQLGSDYLRNVPNRSLGAVVSLQVVEHLQLDDLLELLDLAVEKLRPGGLFVAETPNPAAWIVMHTSFILDPTHVWPLNPALLSFLCERAGFEDVRVEYYSPAETMHLPMVEADDAPAWVASINESFAHLNHVLFGPQDYAVLATAPGG